MYELKTKAGINFVLLELVHKETKKCVGQFYVKIEALQELNQDVSSLRRASLDTLNAMTAYANNMPEVSPQDLGIWIKSKIQQSSATSGFDERPLTDSSHENPQETKAP